jgi:hypothetical protein
MLSVRHKELDIFETKQKFSKFVYSFLSETPSGTPQTIAELLNEEEHTGYKPISINWLTWHFWYRSAPKSKLVRKVSKLYRHRIHEMKVIGIKSFQTAVIARKSGGCVFVTSFNVSSSERYAVTHLLDKNASGWVLSYA